MAKNLLKIRSTVPAGGERKSAGRLYINDKVRVENAIDIAMDAALRTPAINEETSQEEHYSSEEECQVECIPRVCVK